MMKRNKAAVFLTVLATSTILSGCVPSMTQKILASKEVTPLKNVMSEMEETEGSDHEPTVKENQREPVKAQAPDKTDSEAIKEKEAALNPVDMSSDICQMLIKIGALKDSSIDLSEMTNDKMMNLLVKAGYKYDDTDVSNVIPGAVLISKNSTAVVQSCSDSNCTLYVYSKDGSFSAETLPKENLVEKGFDKIFSMNKQ